MAVEVKAGEVYTAQNVRTGEDWTMLRVKAEKGPKELAVFTDRGEAFHENDRVKVVRITSVKLSARKRKDRDGQEKWFDTMSVNADVEVVGAAAPQGFEDMDGDDGDLPF